MGFFVLGVWAIYRIAKGVDRRAIADGDRRRD